MASVIHEIPARDASLVDVLVSEAFGYHPPHRFFQDFPVWGSSAARRFGCFDGPILVSHVGLTTATLDNLKVGMIGAVATVETHRGRGLSTQLLKHAIDAAGRLDVDWLLLWGSEHEFYGKLGFKLDGTQIRVQLGEIVRHMPPAQLKVHRGPHPKIPDPLKHETVKWFWTDAPFAFAGFERGKDLVQLVHECGGDPRALHQIFQTIVHENPQAQLLTHPKLLPSYGIDPAIPFIEERLCLAKPMKGQANLPSSFWVSGLVSC